MVMAFSILGERDFHGKGKRACVLCMHAVTTTSTLHTGIAHCTLHTSTLVLHWYAVTTTRGPDRLPQLVGDYLVTLTPVQLPQLVIEW